MAKQLKNSEKKIYHSTFTYFIPSPPSRKSGYREVEFDKIMSGVLSSGFDLVSLQTVSSTNGIYVVAVLKTKDKKVFQMDSKQDIHEKFKLSHAHSSPDIILEEE
jgi:hypothetical protein